MHKYLTVYAVFECLNIPIENQNQEVNTVNIGNQIPTSSGFFIVNHSKDKKSF